LNHDIYADEKKLEDLYNLAIELKAEKIVALWEDNNDSQKLFEDIEFNMLRENKPETIK
jgi:hypothetical protein